MNFNIDEKFDLIICQNILHFCDSSNIKRAVKNINELIGLDGYLYIRTKNNLEDDNYHEHDYLNLFNNMNKEYEKIDDLIDTDKYTNYIFQKKDSRMARKQLPEEEKKKKLTISINENMLEKLKKVAKEKNISLSQLIENIINKK